VTFELDDAILTRLADLICGDDGVAGPYRAGYQIVRFLQAAGWQRVREVDGSRYGWTLEMLRSRRHDPDALRAVVLRLADPREYLDEAEARVAVVKELNELLALEGYEVTYRGSRPELVEKAPTMARPAMESPAELTVGLESIVSDPVFGRQLRSRLDEASVCWQAGAHTAAVIMLGSVLEGVLYDVATSRHVDGPRPQDRLEGLIDLAGEKGWIARDVVDYAHVLRGHRNLVHPRRQHVDGYQPDNDIVRIAWNVVVAALNDLAG
jgi:hypothetical protein